MKSDDRVKCALVICCIFFLLCACSGNKALLPAKVSLKEEPDKVGPVEIKRKDTSYVTGTLPIGWTRLNVGKADVAFTNQYHNATIIAVAHCGYAKHVPLVALRNHLLLDITHRQIESQEETVLDARFALKTVVNGHYENAPIKLTMYTTQIDKCVYDFVYISAPESFSACQSDFDSFVSGFHTERIPFNMEEESR